MSHFSRRHRHGTSSSIRTTHLGMSKHDLERDSGFSDASSEYLSTVDLTDSEGAGRTGSIYTHDSTGPPVAGMGGSYPGLSPMIIMNHFVPNQQSLVSQTQKQWGFSSPMDLMPQSQMVLFQPMVSNNNNNNNSSSSSSSSKKTTFENVRQSRDRVPTVKTYPRIAPQPADMLPKRVGVSRVKGCSTSGSTKHQRKHHHSHRPYSSTSSQPPLQAPVRAISNYNTFPGNSCLQLSEEEFTSEMDSPQDPLLMDSNKLQRFSNTYNILHQSGLLGITMRTKQLIKENKHTQSQLQQLQGQTALLLEALSSRDPQVWTRLQLSLQTMDKEQLGVQGNTLTASFPQYTGLLSQ
uniref:CLOCK-interacting pacemaker a n=1 Tax=Cynoglossus semilaevis TaxID=244447 RepID=A0A3P8UDF6_CYNSE